MPRKSGRLGGLAGSVVEYVIYKSIYRVENLRSLFLYILLFYNSLRSVLKPRASLLLKIFKRGISTLRNAANS
jgi:hypothetical protein